MSPDGAHRLEDLLALLPEEELQALADVLECRGNLASVRDLLLGEGRLERAIAELDADGMAALRHLSGGVPALPPEDEVSDVLAKLLQSGLVYALTLHDEQRLYVPLEVQRELHAVQPFADPDLRLLLLDADDDVLTNLEAIYLSAEEDLDDDTEDLALATACRLADAMERPSTLREIYKTLPAAAREVLGWTCEHGGPLGADEVQELAEDAAKYHDERAGAAVTQLTRFGLLLAHDFGDSGEIFLVPRSFRRTVLNLIDQNLTSQARATYEALIESGHLSFPDEGPHGWGGDALRSFRQLTIGWVAGRIDTLPSEFGVAVGMQVLDPSEPKTGPFASLLLDLSGETAFSRQALRLWLALVDDPWTTELVNTTGGDAARLVTHFSSSTGMEPDDDTEVWLAHLFLLRAQLVLVLSLLPPGKWFPVPALANLFHLLVVRSTIANLGHEALSARFPYEALPDYGVVLARSDRRERIEEWLERWLMEFAGVIGAAEVDRSGTCFRVHPDAFCVFRDSDLWFRTVWEDLSPIVGDDLEIWMPIPNDPGPRVGGLARLWAAGAARIAIERDAHLADLVRLAHWAMPVEEPAGFAFEFTDESVSAAIEAGRDTEEMLLWLAVRLGGEVPPALRGLFPQSSSAVDGPEAGWRTAARDRIDELLLSLESWGASPPGRLLEELRSWAPPAAELLAEQLEGRRSNGKLDEPLTQHLCVLLGELAAVEAIPSLRHILLTSDSELTQHAAATAFMRIGEPALGDLIEIVQTADMNRERRLLAVMALTGLATLHPHTHVRVGDILVKAIENSAFDQDFQTRVALELCRMGHQKAESMVETLQAEDSWASDEWRPEDALWLVRVSPCVWGSLLFSTPMAMLYLVSDEADELAQEAGVRDLIRSVGLSSEALLYGRPKTQRKD